jgi:hypothetical protein
LSSSSVGWVMNSLKELSVDLGHFHGKRRKVIQQNIIARDQMSTFCASYCFWLNTSGARYGSDPTIPKFDVRN